jgi:membrane fusion protein (multidrug efflux system)
LGHIFLASRQFTGTEVLIVDIRFAAMRSVPEGRVIIANTLNNQVFRCRTAQRSCVVKQRKCNCRALIVQQRKSTWLSIIQGRVKSLSGRTKLLVASIVLVIGIVSTWLSLDSVFYERTDDAQIDGQIMPLTARIGGHIQQVNAIEGQMVHAGDVLAIIDQKEYSLALYKATASLAYAENTAAGMYFNAAITVTTAYGGLHYAQAALKSAQARVAASEDKLRADEALLMQVRANRDQLTIVEAVVAADQQVLLETQKQLVQAITDIRNAQTAPQQVSLAKVRAQAAESEVLQCKAQLQQAQLNLSNTIIRSPATGVVGKRRIEAGQNVSVGQELIDVVSLDDVWITANFKQTQLVHLRPGQPVEIKVDAYGRTWKGHVTNLGGGAGSVFSAMPPKGAIVNDLKSMPRVPVRIDFDRPEVQGFNTEDLLKPGLSVEPRVRVRWLPRPRPPNSVLVGPKPVARPVAF